MTRGHHGIEVNVVLRAAAVPVHVVSIVAVQLYLSDYRCERTPKWLSGYWCKHKNIRNIHKNHCECYRLWQVCRLLLIDIVNMNIHIDVLVRGAMNKFIVNDNENTVDLALSYGGNIHFSISLYGDLW